MFCISILCNGINLLVAILSKQEELRGHTFVPVINLTLSFCLVECAEPEMRELLRSINTHNMRYFPQHVLSCTSTFRDIQGSFEYEMQNLFKIDNFKNKWP